MGEPISHNKRIAKNTLMLYIRMLITILVSLYTSRVVLSTLGIVDYGIYNVVGGVAAMFSFLNGTLSGATSRFLTFALGENNKQKLRNTFSAALTVHIVAAALIFVLCETFGLWILEAKLNIPDDRMMATRVLYQLSVLTVMLTITQVPYTAAIIAHERMDIFAYFSLGDVIFKLLAVYVLMIVPFDKLIVYGVLLFIISFVLRMANRMYNVKKFEECSFRLIKDKNYILPMLKFSGYDLLGNLGVMMRTQGINILQNMFWGPAINAATGIAHQVMNTIVGFSSNFLTAIRPRIVKLFAMGSIQEMQVLAERGAKYSFFLLYFISFPCFLEISYILDIWLGNVPVYSCEFLRWIMMFNWINTLFIPILHIIHAVGEMKYMSIINGLIFVLVVPVVYVIYKYCDVSPVFPFILIALCVVMTSTINVGITKHYIPSFKILEYFKAVVQSVVICILGSLLPCIVHYSLSGNTRFICTGIACVISLSLCIILLGLTRHERQVVFKSIKNKVLKIKKNK